MIIFKLKDKDNNYFMNCCCVTEQAEYAEEFATLAEAIEAKEKYSYLGNFEIVEG